MKPEICNMRRFYWLKKYSIYFILLLAAILRLRQLNVRDFWYDEAFTGIAIKESWTGMMQMIMADVHPPLYYLSLKLFASFFNYNVFGIRLFSAVFGILCAWAVYLFTKELFGKKASVYASLVATISPFALQYSQEGRMYSMFAFFILMAGYFLIRSLRVTDPVSKHRAWFTSYGVYKHSVLFGLFLGLSALTHYMGIIFAPIFYLVYIIWNVSKSSVKLNELRFKIDDLRHLLVAILPNKQIFFGFITALLVFSPWISNFIRHVVKNATSNSLDWIRPANFGDIAVNIQMFIFGTPLGEMSSGMPGPNEFYGIADISMWVAVTVFITAIVIYLLYPKPSHLLSSRASVARPGIQEKVSEIPGFRLKGRNDNKHVAVLLVLLLSLGFMALIWLLGFFGKYYFVARYLLPAGYFVFVLLGVWLSRLRLPYRALAVGFYIVLLFLTVPLGYSEGWNEFTKNLDKYKSNEFYILNSFDYVIAKYYLGADRLILYNVDWPPYNPDYWAAIGPSLKRTENFEDLRNDKNSLIISNTQLGGQDNVNFDPTGLEIVAQYKNILIYRFR